jgi:hypothetical protein
LRTSRWSSARRSRPCSRGSGRARPRRPSARSRRRARATNASFLASRISITRWALAPGARPAAKLSRHGFCAVRFSRPRPRVRSRRSSGCASASFLGCCTYCGWFGPRRVESSAAWIRRAAGRSERLHQRVCRSTSGRLRRGAPAAGQPGARLRFVGVVLGLERLRGELREGGCSRRRGARRWR